MGDFTLAFKQINDKTEKQLNRIIKKTVFDLTSAIIQDTPVDTGRLRANWLVSFNTPIDAELKLEDKEGDTTIAKAKALISGNKVPLVYWIQNNLPYARVVEYGLYPRFRVAPQVKIANQFALAPKPITASVIKFGTRYEIRDRDKFVVETGYVQLSKGGYSKKAPSGMVRINSMRFNKYLKDNIK